MPDEDILGVLGGWSMAKRSHLIARVRHLAEELAWKFVLAISLLASHLLITALSEMVLETNSSGLIFLRSFVDISFIGGAAFFVLAGLCIFSYGLFHSVISWMRNLKRLERKRRNEKRTAIEAGKTSESKIAGESDG